MYTLLNSVAAVILLHIGHNFVDPKHLSQHSLQHVCQQPVETVGSLYGSRQMRHREDVDEETRVDSCNVYTISQSRKINIKTSENEHKLIIGNSPDT